MVSRDEVKNAMDILGITDVHVEYAYVKKVYKKLLLKWHPDSCPEGKIEEYTKRSAEINSAFDVLEKAYKLGMMGPGVNDFRETSSERTNDKTKANSESSYAQPNSTKQDNTSNTNSYYRDFHKKQQREYVRREYERKNSRYLLHNAVWNFIFYAICIKHIYRIFTEIDLEYKNMYIKETPYYFSVLIVIFYALKLMYVSFVLDGSESELMHIFCKIYMPIAFLYPFIYTFLHGENAAIVFSLYFAGWAIFEWFMNVKIYANLDVLSIGIIKGKKLSLPFVFFTVEEFIAIVFGIYVAIAAVFIK